MNAGSIPSAFGRRGLRLTLIFTALLCTIATAFSLNLLEKRARRINDLRGDFIQKIDSGVNGRKTSDHANNYNVRSRQQKPVPENCLQSFGVIELFEIELQLKLREPSFKVGDCQSYKSRRPIQLLITVLEALAKKEDPGASGVADA